MAKKKNENVIIKKVSPYPIRCKLTGNSGDEMNGYILKLTQFGLMVEVKELSLKAGRSFDITFTLPVLGYSFSEKTRVVKTYDRIHTSIPADSLPMDEEVEAAQKQAAEEEVEKKSRLFRLAELHFLGMNLSEKKKLRQFLMKIQRPPDGPDDPDPPE